jgi:hypothetical protein
MCAIVACNMTSAGVEQRCDSLADSLGVVLLYYMMTENRGEKVRVDTRGPRIHERGKHPIHLSQSRGCCPAGAHQGGGQL